MEIEYLIFSLKYELDLIWHNTSGKLKSSLFGYLHMVRKDAASTNPPFSRDSNNITVAVMPTLISIIWSHSLLQSNQKHDFQVWYRGP